MTERVRRSSRIQKQLPIILVGSDMEGRMFSERTHTVVLSRHGAGIVSEHRLSPEQELVIRLEETNKEAEIRLVGQLAAEDGKYIYGVAFLDPNLDFWGIEFPPPTDLEKEAGRKILECSSCKTREKVDQLEIEADVFTINQSVIRYCTRCGSSTIWRAAAGNVKMPSDVASHEAKTPPPSPSLVAAPLEQPAGAPSSVTLEPVSPLGDSLAPVPSAAVSPAAALATPVTLRHENRRKHVRTKVSFKACVRSQSFPEDIVSCEDISRGGLRFKSRQRYSEGQTIEVAAPYEPGSQNIFVPARIAFVTELTDDRLFRCGVAYLTGAKRG